MLHNLSVARLMYWWFSDDQFVLSTDGDAWLKLGGESLFWRLLFSLLPPGKLSPATLSVMQIKNGCDANPVFACVICLVFDLMHSKAPLFPKETLMEHFYVWSAFTSLWFCLFEKQIYEKRSCDTQLLCACVHVCARDCACVCVCVSCLKLMNTEQMAQKWWCRK